MKTQRIENKLYQITSDIKTYEINLNNTIELLNNNGLSDTTQANILKQIKILNDTLNYLYNRHNKLLTKYNNAVIN